jgi:hypothetical protein
MPSVYNSNTLQKLSPAVSCAVIYLTTTSTRIHSNYDTDLDIVETLFFAIVLMNDLNGPTDPKFWILLPVAKSSLNYRGTDVRT